MNCPSRTDDVDLNPGWNQNPPFLAADLTTCEDLNGMINARQLKRDSRGGSHPTDDSLREEYLARSSKMQPDRSRSILGGWALWLLSVFLTAFILSNLHIFRLSTLKTLIDVFQKDSMAQPRRPLSKRATCATGGVNKADYDVPLHVGALFVILFVSATGCAFPMLVLKFPKLRIPASFLFTARHFGTGVLIATAFVHLLPTAFLSLGNPCLSSFWTDDYPAMPGAIALAAVFMLTVIEMSFSPGRTLCCSGQGDLESVSRRKQAQEEDGCAAQPQPSTRRKPPRPQLATVVDGSSPLRDKGPLFGRSSSFSRTLARLGEESRELDQVELSQLREQSKKMDSDDTIVNLDDADTPSESSDSSEELHAHKRAVLQVMLLEMGILFHSVFIGMSLSVSIGSDFIVLLIAIIFHQTFEGLALGARIASIKWPNNAMQPWIMAFAYGCTTPVGQAIGLATHTLYRPDSEVGLLVVGIMNAISAGLLIFASLVELLSEDFLSDESWRVLRGKRRVWACVLVFLGAFLMSLVGAWA
ncbi:Zip-domain-containing protein [Westerdykella ornata]|uniref:Zip-domain-containing protein n=1 Tax=Westerdykella ornata TaxID=318751 RepID=A0A6A6J9X5_WESOR|nr:Zip-domain-containing protein [Westerdykella ornata]KAF2273192.1 Zip-domain-containing protein [Westerdykella ornata]